MNAPSPREATPIDGIAEDWVRTLIDLDPDVAVVTGLRGRIGELADYAPEGRERFADAARATVARLEAATPVDAVDVVTRTDLLAELGLELESFERRLHERDLDVIASPAQGIREAFDLMPTATADDWAVIGRRLRNLPAAVDGYIATLRRGIADGVVPARRQVVEVARQAREHGDPAGFFAVLVGSARLDDGSGLLGAVLADLDEGGRASRAAYHRLADFLETELAPAAGEDDAVGREHYALASRRFLGTDVDLDETYEWGIEELARMVEEQTRVAGEILPGASVEEAIARLDRDPSRTLHGTDALRRWMQETSDRAVADLAASHFDIPEPVRRLECMIAPTHEGGIYYTGPSDDFSRAGRMWWSVPEGVTEFTTWRERTTVYHEGVPGHHLQIGQAVFNRGALNTWRRQLAGTSGHAEGWALYAERLMAELGHLDDPADRLGMLDGQRMRAARVVLDIGVHLRKPKPRIQGFDEDGAWDADFALRFLRRNVAMDDAVVRFEVNRYLGWPGQAPSYKVGQRIWEQVRDAVAAREGAAFSLRDFHRRALDLGGVGLGTLQTALLS